MTCVHVGLVRILLFSLTNVYDLVFIFHHCLVFFSCVRTLTVCVCLNYSSCRHRWRCAAVSLFVVDHHCNPTVTRVLKNIPTCS